MTDRCKTCPYLDTTVCTFYVLGWHLKCERDNFEGQNKENHGEKEPHKGGLNGIPKKV